jgi:hypothetical protein
VHCKIKPDIVWFSTLIYSSVALCLLEPDVSSSTCDAHMGFQLTRMPARTKHDDGHLGAPPSSHMFISISFKPGFASHSMSIGRPTKFRCS